MSLNVQWRWNMPTVGNANEVAKTNQDYFMQGMDAIGQGIIKGGENKREDEKQAWLEDKDFRDFQHKVAQDKLAQNNETRNYFLRYDQLGLLKDKQKFDQDRQRKQDRLAQMNANRNYMLQRDIFNQNKKRSDFDMNRQSKQDEWLQKFYDLYFGNSPDEIERIKLLEELKSLPGWQDLL